MSAAAAAAPPLPLPLPGPEPRWHLFWVANAVALAVFAVSTTFALRFWQLELHVGAHAAAFPLTQWPPWFALSAVGSLASLYYLVAFCGVAFMSDDAKEIDVEEERQEQSDRERERRPGPRAVGPQQLQPEPDLLRQGQGVVAALRLRSHVAGVTSGAGSGSGGGDAGSATSGSSSSSSSGGGGGGGVAPKRQPTPQSSHSPIAGARALAGAALSPGPLESDVDVAIIGMGIVGASLAATLARQGKRVVVFESARHLKETVKGELLQPGGVRALERMGLAAAAKSAEIDGVRVDGYVCMMPNGAGEGAAAGTDVSTEAELQSTVVLSYPTADPDSASQFFGLVGSGNAAAAPLVTRANASTTAPPGTAGTSAVACCPETGCDLQPKGRSFHHVRFVGMLRRLAEAERNVTVRWARATGLVAARELPDIARAQALARGEGAEAGAAAAAAAAPVTDPERVCGVTWCTDDATGATETVLARLTVVADGMFSQLREGLHASAPKRVSMFCGLVLRHAPHDSPLPFPNRGHVVLVDPSPVLFYQISSTDTRVLVDVPWDTYAAPGGLRAHFTSVVAPQLPAGLRAPFLAAAASQEPKSMPCLALSGSAPRRAGCVMLGDTLNMRHPLTGGGMTVALKDVELLARCLLGGLAGTGRAAGEGGDVGGSVGTDEGRDGDGEAEAEGAGVGAGGASARPSALRGDAPPPAPPLPIARESPALAAAVKRFYSERRAHAATINVLANALYRVFSRPPVDADGRRARLRAACIEYLSMGGAFAAGPVGLLSGLTPATWVLVTHFFCVACYAVGKALVPFPTPQRLRRGYDLMHVACTIIMPLLAAERATFLSWSWVGDLVDCLFPWRAHQL